MKNIFKNFFESEKAGGLTLLFCTALSLILSNVTIGDSYIHFWHQKVNLHLGLNYSVEHWVNDGLMAIFFLLIGLEIKRELYVGELSHIKNALLPVVAAIGGMIVPATIHFIFNKGLVTQSGFGIPMATDIAFALGVLSLLGKRVPLSLKIFLTALAIIDDLGAIIVIALFYTKGFSIAYFSAALGILVILAVFNWLKLHRLFFYLIPGILLWYCMLKSGVHATIAGVLLAFTIPFREESHNPSDKLQHFLHKPVAFFIVPVFAFANTAIKIPEDLNKVLDMNTVGIALGLIIGKPVGIMSFCWAAVKTKVCRLPKELNWRLLFGTGLLAGIGFTMSIFIATLAFAGEDEIVASKMAILAASLVAGGMGFLYLKLNIGKKPIHPKRNV